MKTLLTKKTENTFTNAHPYLTNTLEFGWLLYGANPSKLNMTGGSIADES